MATEWISPTWRMPNDKNQSKFENYSLDFDAATDEYINCGTGVGDYFGNSYTGPLSISLWFKANATNSDDGLIWFSNNPTNSHGAFSFNISSNEIRVRNVATSKIAFTDTTSWHHLVAVMDASAATTGKIYLDGVLQSEYFTYSSINLLSNVLYIGTYYNVVGKTFDGNTSQVSIFDYALSQGQIDYLYNSGTPQNPMAISGQPPIAYYPLGGSSTGDAAAASPSTLTVPNESVADATVFDFDGDPHIVCDSNFFTPSGTVGGAGNFMQVCSISWWMKSSRAGSYSVIFHLSGNGAWILRIDNVGNMWWFAGSGTNYVKSIGGEIIKPDIYSRLTRSSIRNEINNTT